jgi:hypothetical protein
MLSVVTLAAGAWLYSWVLLLGYAALAAYRNRVIIGIRTYPRDEHLKRVEQWLLLPLIAFWASVLGSLGTNLLLSDKWSIGFLLVASTFTFLTFVSAYVGLVRRPSTGPSWESIASLEALHAEIEFRDARSLDHSDISAIERRLKSLQRERASSYRPRHPEPPSKPFDWRPQPRFGLGVVRDESGDPVDVPLQAIALFAFLRSRLLQGATAYHGLTVASLLVTKASVLLLATAAVGLVCWLSLTLYVARGHLISLWREESEHREVTLSEAKRRRSGQRRSAARSFVRIIREYL